MTTKPKKHKQRFEHLVWCCVDIDQFSEKLIEKEKYGWELVSTMECESLRWGKKYFLFFKRPV